MKKKTSKNSNFSDFVCHFLFAQNVPFIKKISFCKRFFWDQSWLEQTPPTGFLDFFLIFKIFVFDICIYLKNWGVEGAMCKISEFWDRNWQRNNFSKLATFDPIFQLPHSALGRSFFTRSYQTHLKVSYHLAWIFWYKIGLNNFTFGSGSPSAGGLGAISQSFKFNFNFTNSPGSDQTLDTLLCLVKLHGKTCDHQISKNGINHNFLCKQGVSFTLS